MTALQFSHANGFPARSYGVLLDALSARFDVGWVEKFGHDPRYPVTDGWPHLVEELIAAVEARGQPVVGVGHSLGGYLTLFAAAKRPELFRCVVLLDAPIVDTLRSAALFLFKRVGLLERLGPGAGTARRRTEWPDHSSAVAHFAPKPVFRRFDGRCLDDYVRHATEPGPTGIRLTFRPDVEHSIYQTLPHRSARAVRALRVPAGLVVGRESVIVRQFGLTASRRHLRVERVPGGHLFPMEHPEAVAEAVMKMAHNLARL